MNILMTSVGTRVRLVEYFTLELKGSVSKVYATDVDANAPALHFADDYFIVPRIDAENYIEEVLRICEENEIDAVISLIDPELELISMNKKQFEDKGIRLILSPLDMLKMAYDKLETADYLKKLGIPTVPTYRSKKAILKKIQNEVINFPLIAKPRKGSASIGITVIENKEQLNIIDDTNNSYILQPFFKDKEYGVDAYIDMNSGRLVNMFIKEKLRMRSGETDKSISIHDSKIEALVIDLIDKTNFIGPLDIDLFKYKGAYYISEINPRFGGGYPHAYECGINFTKYIINNLNGIANDAYKGLTYESDIIMMKYDDILIR